MVAAILDASAPGRQMSQIPGICSVTSSQGNMGSWNQASRDPKTWPFRTRCASALFCWKV